MCRPGSRVCPLTPCREGVRVTTGETCEATRAFTCDQCFESHADQCRLFGPSRELGSPPDQLIIKIDSGAHASNLSPIDAAGRDPSNAGLAAETREAPQRFARQTSVVQ